MRTFLIWVLAISNSASGYGGDVATVEDKAAPPAAQQQHQQQVPICRNSTFDLEDPKLAEQEQQLLKEIQSEDLADLQRQQSVSIIRVDPKDGEIAGNLGAYRKALGLLASYKSNPGRGSPTGPAPLRQKDQDAIFKSASQNLPNVTEKYPRLENLSPDERAAIEHTYRDEVRSLPAKRTSSEREMSALASVQEKALSQINKLIFEQPFLPYLSKRVPGPADIAAAKKEYRAALPRAEQELKTLDLKSSDARYLVLHRSSAKVLQKNPQLCTAYNKLLTTLKAEIAGRRNSTTALALGGVGLCMVGGAVSGGLVFLGCMIGTGVGGAAMSASFAYESGRGANALAPAVAAGQAEASSVRDLEKERDSHTVDAYIAGATTIPVGTAAKFVMGGRAARGAPAGVKALTDAELEAAHLAKEVAPWKPNVSYPGPGKAKVEWQGIRDRIEATAKEHGIEDYKDLTVTIYKNGVPVSENIPWNKTAEVIDVEKFGQVDYYVVYKRPDGSIADISRWEMRQETKDLRTLAEGSFTGKAPGENFGVRYSDEQKAQGLSEELTRNAVNIANERVAWSVNENAPAGVRKFIEGSDNGVDVVGQMGAKGEPERFVITDRKTGKSMITGPENIDLMDTAGFSSNQFSWDAAMTAKGSVLHRPWMARSTILKWADILDSTNGAREVRANGRSLWFSENVTFPGKPEANLNYTNPFLLNRAADKLYRFNPSPENLEVLKRVSKSIDKYTAWMENPASGRAIYDKNGKVIGFNGSALGSGLDNSRFNVGNANELAGRQRGFVDFLSQHIAMLKDNAKWHMLFAREATDPAKKAEYVARARELHNKALEYTKTLDQKYYDPVRKFHFDIHPDANGQYVQDHRTTPVSGFWPTYAKAVDRTKLNEIAETQMVPDKFGGPLPSNSRDTVVWDPKVRPLEYVPARDPKTGKIIDSGYHDGDGVWPPNTTAASDGFNRSGRPDVAHNLTRDMVNLMSGTSTKNVYESYTFNKVVEDGVTKIDRKPLVHSHHETRGKFAGWSQTPVTDGAVRDLVGMDPTYRHGMQWNLRTNLTPGKSTDLIGTDNLQYMGGNVKQMHLTRLDKNTYQLVVQSEKPFEFRLGSLLNKQGQLTADVNQMSNKIRVEGGNKKQVIELKLRDIDWKVAPGRPKPARRLPLQAAE